MRQSEAARTRAAVVDVGSNSIHLLVADRVLTPSGYRIRRLSSPATLLALGRTVAASGRIDARAAAELTRVVGRQVKQAEKAGATELHVVATAAVRQAANGRRCMAELGEAIGQPVRVLTERREAELGFLGVVHELDPRAEQLVVDGGGASTEVTLTRGRRRAAAAVLPVGGSLLSVEYDDPPAANQLDRLRERVGEALRALPPGRPAAAVATGGSARNLPVILGGRSGDPLDQALIARALSALQAVPAAVLAKGTGLPLRRVQSLAAGAVILAGVLRHYGLDGCRITPHGLREGVLVAAAVELDHWWVDVAEVAERRQRFEDALVGAAAGT